MVIFQFAMLVYQSVTILFLGLICTKNPPIHSDSKNHPIVHGEIYMFHTCFIHIQERG